MTNSLDTRLSTLDLGMPRYQSEGRTHGDGIPDYLRYPEAEDQVASDKLQKLLDITAQRGWKEAIGEVFKDEPGFVDYISHSDRFRFIELLELKPSQDVLEIGPGLGQMARRIAPRVRTYSALEVVKGQARFVASSCGQEGLTNVQVACGGDDCTLPYVEHSFDVVVLSLVLEWCGDRNKARPHLLSQMQLLSEIYRVLRPGGRAYICTKNRFALKYLIGKGDEHVHGIPFGNALPRRMLDVILRVRGLPRPNGYLHSFGALSSLLRERGFDQIRSYWAHPEMRFPAGYVGTDATSIRLARRGSNFVQGEMRSTRWLMRFIPAALVKWFTPGLVFLVQRPR